MAAYAMYVAVAHRTTQFGVSLLSCRVRLKAVVLKLRRHPHSFLLELLSHLYFGALDPYILTVMSGRRGLRDRLARATVVRASMDADVGQAHQRKTSWPVE